jgi:glycosyltransferase involved in cell wall biosynthesis
MLRACLDSLTRQVVPSDLSLAIVVVDNEPEGDAEHTVSSFTATTDIPVHYVHEPRRGIATARNAILDKASELAADFIAMTDECAGQ